MQNLIYCLLALGLVACTGASESSPTVSASAEATVAPQPPKRYAYTMEYLTGKFDPARHVDFIKIDPQYADRGGMYLRKDAYDAFIEMHRAAAKDGINLVIRSATRNFEAQKGIWEAKWNGSRKIENGKDAKVTYPDPATRALKILEYSSMPGTSRHHWGTDIDLNNFNNEWFSKGEGLRLYEWLSSNAANFGFCQPYTEKGTARPDGYNEERWHWSYTPVSKELLEQAEAQLKDGDISGFQGAATAPEIEVVRKYVLGINQACR